MKPVGVALAVCAGFAAVLGAPLPARADDPHAAAHEHFDKGLAASHDERFAEAAAEFEKAYELWPDYRVLYNIGRVEAALGRSVEAVDAFEAYLAQGDADLPEDRKTEVRATIAAQRAHVATVSLQIAAGGAELRVDGKLVGHAPLAAPLRLTEGPHTLEAIVGGRAAALEEVDLAGGTATEIVLTFTPVPTLELQAPPLQLVAAPPREAPRRSRTLGVLVVASGAAVAIAGAVLAYEGAQSANAARARLVEAARPAPPGTPDVGAYDAAKLSFDDAKTRNQLGWALVGVGGAAIIGGVVLTLRSSGASTRADRGVSVSLLAPPGGLAIGGSW